MSQTCAGADDIVYWSDHGTGGSSAGLSLFSAGALIQTHTHRCGRDDRYFGDVPAGFTHDRRYLVWLGDWDRLTLYGSTGPVVVPGQRDVMRFLYFAPGEPIPGHRED